MDVKERLKTLTPQLLFAAVLAILISVGVIQFAWFCQSGAAELGQTVQSLESTVRQTAVREFQRYGPVIAELQGGRDHRPLTEAEGRALALRIAGSYGPEGTVAPLLRWVGISVAGGEGYERLDRGVWKPEAGKSDWDDPSQNVLGFPLGPDPEGTTLLLALNTQDFFRTYVGPALTELFPGAEVAWQQGLRGPPPREALEPKVYPFNPLLTLLRGRTLSRVLEVPLVTTLDLGRPTPGAPPQPGDRPQFRGLTTWTIRLTLPADAPVLGTEGRLAWNWLGSTLLLVVLAAAFALVLEQSRRVEAQRRREREFVALVSHELRTPLTVIRSAADNFIQGIVPPERQGRYGQLIHEQSLRLGRMIEQMLAFAQAEGPVTPRAQALLAILPWLEEVKPPLETLAATRSVGLHWDGAALPAEGRTDPDALRMIVENLVVNAINHAYPGTGPVEGRPVRITLRHLVPDRIEITVDDDGRGIAPKEARKVFDPFYRDQVSRDNQERGSGLGLFLALRQVRRMGGTLTLESPWRRPDGSRRSGCRFTAVLPFTAEVTHVR